MAKPKTGTLKILIKLINLWARLIKKGKKLRENTNYQYHKWKGLTLQSFQALEITGNTVNDFIPINLTQMKLISSLKYNS